MTASSEAVIDVNLSLEFTMPIVEQALMQISASITNRQHTLVIAHKGASFKSWGENITVSISQISSDLSRVHIKSQSALVTTLFDMGMNSSNVEKFLQTLRSLAIEKKMILDGNLCPKCLRELPAGTQFCPNDGTQITRECSKCGYHNAPSAKFCSKCGVKM